MTADHEAVAFEWYPPLWVQRLDGAVEHIEVLSLDDFLRVLDEVRDEDLETAPDDANEGWYSFCRPCAEYVIHDRPGGGWVPCGPGDLPFPCSRCKEPLP